MKKGRLGQRLCEERRDVHSGRHIADTKQPLSNILTRTKVLSCNVFSVADGDWVVDCLCGAFVVIEQVWCGRQQMTFATQLVLASHLCFINLISLARWTADHHEEEARPPEKRLPDKLQRDNGGGGGGGGGQR